MLVGCAGLLMASLAIADVPPAIAAKLTATNETHGTFVQTKRLPPGEAYVSRGTYCIRPQVDFTWRTTEPFETLFWADQSIYVYSNEDERVEKPLADLPGFARFAAAGRGDCAEFFQAFDVLYKEDDDATFHVLAKPKDARLKKVLARVEADGVLTNWVLTATFPNRTVFEIRFCDE